MDDRYGWTVDETSGHLAHASGLYAYYSKLPTETGGVLCVGPFSSYIQRISRADALTYTREAIELIEAIVPGYTVWGTYSATTCGTSHKVNVLGEYFDFVANPCFRTSTLLHRNENATTIEDKLAREWQWCNGSSEVAHRMGLRFAFSQSLNNKLDCCVSLTKRTRDLSFLHDKLKPILLKSLCTTAVSVLRNLSSDGLFQKTQEISLSIRIAADVLSE